VTVEFSYYNREKISRSVREKRLKTSLLPYLHNNAKKINDRKKQQINILRFLQASGAASIDYFANRLIEEIIN